MLPQKSVAAWDEPMPGENNRWFDRFSRYLDLGATRSVRAVYAAEKVLDGSKSVPASWTEATHRFDWQRRAEHYDAEQRRRLFACGNASDTERVRKLDDLAERMHSRLIAGLDAMEINEKFLAQYLAVMDSLAKHTGGYAPQRHEVTGKDGGKIEIEEEQTMRVVFYVPEVDKIKEPDAAEQIEGADDHEPE